MSNASLELGGGKWAAKEGNLLGYASSTSSSKYVPREFSFTRAADIAATRVNSSGLIEKYRENLLLQSNNFSSNPPWGNTSMSFTSGENGYDGSSDAWIIERVGVNAHIRQTPPLGNVMTFSIFAKANTLNWVRIRTGSVQNAYFNLDPSYSGNRIGFTQNLIDSTITDIGNGWFRCTATAIGYDRFYIYPVVDNNDVSGTSGSIYIQDSQAEKGLAATSYLESGATTAKAGVLDNLPRIDYTGGTASLLLEPQRTNLITYSEYFDSWTKIGSPTVTNNYGISPEGVQNSTRFEAISDRITTGVSTVNANETFSIYMKGSGTLLIQIGSNQNFYPTLTSEWVRYEFTTTQAGTNDSVQIRGNGSAVDVELYGAQYERNTYPTSYIPTYGTSDTRAEDTFQNNTNDKPLGAIGQGTWFVELQKLGDDTNQALYLAPTTSNTQQIRLHFDASNARFRDARNGFATIGGGVNVKTSMTKMALSIDTTSGIAKVYANGSQLGSDYTLQANTFEFSRIVAEGKGFILKQSLFFPNALSGSELAALTT